LAERSVENMEVINIQEAGAAGIDQYLERIFLVLRNIAHLSSIYSKYLQKNFDVTTSQLLCLRALAYEDGLSAGEIGRRIFIKPGTITGLIDRLEGKGLVRRTRVHKDRRVINVEITQAGRELAGSAPVPVQSLLAVNLKKLPLEEVEKMTQALERLLKLMQSEEVTTELTLATSEDQVF